ncbi:penicillin-binding protein 2 [Salipaludibacillus agaradhaerens]|uniref:peptidoglycan D,D-transpeptidase FtsI family protein n=1 Tax=Salipaludibacillus agaradhaerens TaxID=76935 RepID=UPI0021518083|nr:penicillin-binding protein 2 [Salipaludibacillus agaradhaerens]MCR6106363.1 penicillin-binding protein 2 [Salipaludibacillus agaradhaerens]MCR6118396.1 penicillin-binding protein 2 [Salipaludibacillus agaradhaerens]UJW57502.1 penicillin-binding protein 2 [Bacillus sp. A116_S68]
MSEKKGQKPHLPVRLNILFFVVFLLFSALILRLGIVQIVQGEEYQEELERTVNISHPVEAPRGLIYDRYGNILVDNELLLTVTYTNRNTTQAEMLEVAAHLNEFITMEYDGDLEGRFERDRKEYWALLNKDEFEAFLPMSEAGDMTDEDIHKKRLEQITEDHLSQLTDEEIEIFFLWREFNSGYNNLPHKVMQGIEYEEAAQIIEHIEELPGVDIIRDSTRKYVYGDTLRGVFGSVGAIPRDNIDEFLSLGYERNEEVGRSYLEAQYESVLRGNKGEIENFTDQSGNLLRNAEEKLGSRGNDLVLTLDMELQQLVQDAIENEVTSGNARFIAEKDAFVVMMDPNTGDVLSMAGYSSDLGTFTQAYEAGSSIKGATVLAGLDTGVIGPGSVIYDRPITLPGSPPISSVNNLGPVDDLTALERSSNIYMVEIAMRIIGYVPGVSGRNWGDLNPGFNTLRSYYNQFGLGIETGIDLPNEFSGMNGGNPTRAGAAGSYLFLSFGQFDTYTTMQLAQYVSTIANDGYRVAPRIVQEIRQPGSGRDELGAISQQVETKILNYLDVDSNHLNRIQQGFYRVVHGGQGTARAYFRNVGVDVAGKTGTAQVMVNGEKGNNQTFVGYAPYDDPEVAIAVVVPGTRTEHTAGVANRIAEKSLEAYFDLKENRNGPEVSDDGGDIEKIDNTPSN